MKELTVVQLHGECMIILKFRKEFISAVKLFFSYAEGKEEKSVK